MNFCPGLLFGTIIIFAAGLARGQEPTPPSSPLARALQQKLDAVVSYFSTAYPDLAMSLAWRDSSNDVAITSGKVSGHAISPSDTFLFGSGTKPFTATAVLRLVDSGKVKATDKVSKIIDPYMRKHGKPALSAYFGEAVGNATVLELIRMSAGIRDFEDSYDFDNWVLGNSSKFWDYPYDAMRFAASADNTKGGSPLYCNPGNCSAYSSTSYEVAGLLLAAVLQPRGEWYNFDLASAIFDDRKSYPSMSFPPVVHGHGPPHDPQNGPHMQLNHFLSVPGAAVSDSWQNTTIYEQHPSILGWTCGNLIASPRDVAKFFFNLLDSEAAQTDPTPLLSEASRTEMTTFRKLTTGWNAGKLLYGAGMMKLDYHGINVTAHEGDTYGFLSTQAYVPDLKGSFSIVSNVDAGLDGDYPYTIMACHLLQTVLNFTGSSKQLGCKHGSVEPAILV